MHDVKFHLDRQKSATVRVVDVIDGKFRACQQVSESCIVPDEHKVLLLCRKQWNIRLLVFTVGSKEMVPERHKEAVISVEVGVMTKMSLWCVEQISQRRKSIRKGPVPNSNVHVTKGVNEVEADQVGANDGPVLVATREEGNKEGGAKGSNVNKVLLEVLDQRCRGSGVDGQMVEAMHVLHLARNVKPTMDSVVQWFDEEDVA
jgi:hypothetical protein